MGLIQNHLSIRNVNFGLEEKKLDNYKSEYYDQIDEMELMLASRFIIRIFTLVFYEARNYIKNNLRDLYEESLKENLTDLQAELAFVMGNFKTSIDIYMRSPSKLAKGLVFDFLENSFKRLVLEKRAEEKKSLTRCITQEIK